MSCSSVRRAVAISVGSFLSALLLFLLLLLGLLPIRAAVLPLPMFPLLCSCFCSFLPSLICRFLCEGIAAINGPMRLLPPPLLLTLPSSDMDVQLIICPPFSPSFQVAISLRVWLRFRRCQSINCDLLLLLEPEFVGV